jgi:hypothetical protein
MLLECSLSGVPGGRRCSARRKAGELGFHLLAKEGFSLGYFLIPLLQLFRR